MLDELFNKNRGRLFNLAYRMLGSVTDAEDVVQETWIRWSQLEIKNIRSADPYLSRIITNLCIDLLRTRNSPATKYKGPWLPEPILADYKEQPAYQIESTNNLSIALLFMLEKLKPNERAVFVLKEAFDLSHNEIAETLNIHATNSRKLLSRAKNNLTSVTSKKIPDKAKQKQLLEKLVSALMQENISDIKKILSQNAVAYTDGGGVVSAAIIPLKGADRIIQVFSHLFKSSKHPPKIELLDINGEIGVAVLVDKKLSSVISFLVLDEKIDQVYVQRNPLKLRGFVFQFEKLKQ